jgi:aspartate aminotransferase-like enzyme
MAEKIREPFTPDRLFCPGPTPIPAEVVNASTCNIYHRGEEFQKIFKSCCDDLVPLFGAKNSPVILTSSGTGAMEAVVVSLTSVDDEVLVVNGGKFGERWEKLTTVYQCRPMVIKVPWGEAPKPSDIIGKITKQTRAIFIQANETSTGAYFPVKEIAQDLRASGYKGLLVVDAISSLGAHEMNMEAWGIDAVVAGSQKGFGLPPGLAFVALSDRALGSFTNRPRFYFDLAKELKGQKEGRSAWTPAISLINGLRETLNLMTKVGFDRVLDQHKRMAEGTRAAVEAMGLELFAKNCPSRALTSIKVPAGIDGVQWLKRVRKRFGMFVAGGQDELKGKIVRFSHLGFISQFDVIDGLAALELALGEEGYKIDTGIGVKAALGYWARNPG